MIAFAVVCLILAAAPVCLIAANWSRYRPLPAADANSTTPISVLIPARNEEHQIAKAIDSVLSSRYREFELIVLDDHSTDNTAAIVTAFAARDARVRLAHAPPLPAGWCGKQHACSELARVARHDLLLWIDADVTLQHETLARVECAMRDGRIGLLSGFPRQHTHGWCDRLLIPLIHFVLLGYLPLGSMRASLNPSLGAGCGQLFIARRDAYSAAGGHAAIKSSMHDGIQLPRAFRRAGRSTDLFDATDAASCTMYSSARDTWNGLLKNAGEGMATPAAILPWTVLLLFGSVAPPVLAVAMLAGHERVCAIVIMLVAATLPIAARLMMMVRFRQPLVAAILHPAGVALLLVIQWQALARQGLKRPPQWKDRIVH